MLPTCGHLRTLLQAFFPDYLRLVEPDSAQHLRLDQAVFLRPEPPGWDEEDGPLPPLLAEVPGLRGETVTVLIQVEPEAPSPDEISDRLGSYFTDLEIRYCQPVLLSVVCLRGARPGVNLETAVVSRVFGIEVLRMFYTLFGLAGAGAEHYLERKEPLAWALAALMRPARLSRPQLREACRERIAAARLEEARRSLLALAVEAFLEETDLPGPLHPPSFRAAPARFPGREEDR